VILKVFREAEVPSLTILAAARPNVKITRAVFPDAASGKASGLPVTF